MTSDAWKEPSGAVRLGAREAHVWLCTTAVSDSDVEACLELLADGERHRAARYPHRAGKTGYVVTRAALRVLLGEYLGIRPTAVSLRYLSTGKPVLAEEHESGLKFSVSHARDVALLSFARVDVGVDVEYIRPVARAGRIVDRIFAQPIRELLSSLPDAEVLTAFFAAWTQREALVKALGRTLVATRDPLDFVWPPPPGPRQFTESAPTGTRQWTIAALPQPEGYAAALVAAGALRRVRLLRLRADRAGRSGT